MPQATLIVNLPGKPKSLRECLDAVFPAITHCLDLIGAAYLEHDPDVSQVFRPKTCRASTVVVPAMQLALSLSIGITAYAAPDIIIPSQRSIVVEAHLDLGALRARACSQHVVAEGDTLVAIARAHLGSADRWPEIVALNPSLDPEPSRSARASGCLPQGPTEATRRRPVSRCSCTAAKRT